MDGCSIWLPFLSGGIGDGISRQATNLSRSGSEVQLEQDLPIRSQVEEQLQQFDLLMDMEKTGHPEPEVVPPLSESSMLHSFTGSPDPDETSSLMPRSSNSNTTEKKSCHYPAADVSSQQIQLHSPVTYYGGGDRLYDHHWYGNLDTILNLDEFNKCYQEPHNERAQHHKNGGHGGSAFMPYARHLSPKKKPKPGSGGQRAIKAAISALARMHMIRLAQWRCYQYQMELAVAPAPPADGSSNCNQQDHVLSERKRREKLNDSFEALRTVLPPAFKKDKASVLIRARDYVSTLESRVSELEENNRMLLVELQHRGNNGGDRGDVSGKKIDIDIDIDREASAVKETSSQKFHLKIVVGSECVAMDAVVSLLEGLKEIGDVRSVAMDTGSRATTLTLQVKSSRRDDNILKEKVIKSVKGAMKSKIETS